MHAFLLIGKSDDLLNNDISNRIHGWGITTWDTVTMNGAGIADARQFRRELAISPQGSSRVGIIRHLDLLTPEAQNALLKTLEEPPPATYILATTLLPEMILPTVRSRMQIVILTEMLQPDDRYQDVLTKLMRSDYGNRLPVLEQYMTTREDAKVFVAGLLAAAHKKLLTEPSPLLALFAKKLLDAQIQLAVNVNQKLVVENLFLSVPVSD